MSNAKHTPGPWHIATGNSHRDFNRWSVRAAKHPCGNGGVFPIANVNYTTLEIGQANARLIAAAPELLGALQRIEKRIAYYASLADGEAPNIEQWSYTDQSGDVAFARAAIAKATGEQA